MPAFDYILILLAAVLLSNLINRFIPVLSPPIVQIFLGVLITEIPFGAFGFDFTLEPELFFVLFIAPLVFHSSMTADKQSLWRLKGPIFGSAVGLVLVTVVSLGFFVHSAVPVIPLAASFALVAALGPTDVVAVEAASKHITVPGRIMGVLSGESIVNDAMGIVCFQFAIAAASTGSFSAVHGLLRFIALGIGGIAAGLFITGLKYMLIRWLRSQGVENTTLHILVDILTPYLIYMCAEAMSVSGVLAVFAAGLAHSFMRDKFNPDTVKLQISRDSVWSVLTFSFEGLVFVMLGTQLPGIFEAVGGHKENLGNWQIAGVILLITLLVELIRFLWWVIIIHNNKPDHGEKPFGRLKSGLIFSLAGARGTVTLAIVMSIPLFLTDGHVFPVRELLILIAGGVIVVTLLITNFILPLLAEQKTGKDRDNTEQAAYREIIHTVISRLNDAATPATHAATRVVTRTYYSRISQKPSRVRRRADTAEEKELRRAAQKWETENTVRLVRENKASEAGARHIFRILDARTEFEDINNKRPKILWLFAWTVRRVFHSRKHVEASLGKEIWDLTAQNARYVLDRLKKDYAGSPAAEKIAAGYNATINVAKAMRDQSAKGGRPHIDEALISRIAAGGYQIERELIQQMYEEGRLSWETARRMRDNIVMLETKLQVG